MHLLSLSVVLYAQREVSLSFLLMFYTQAQSTHNIPETQGPLKLLTSGTYRGFSGDWTLRGPIEKLMI